MGEKSRVIGRGLSLRLDRNSSDAKGISPVAGQLIASRV